MRWLMVLEQGSQRVVFSISNRIFILIMYPLIDGIMSDGLTMIPIGIVNTAGITESAADIREIIAHNTVILQSILITAIVTDMEDTGIVTNSYVAQYSAGVLRVHGNV
ncbi:MAG: hypothetical protein ACRBHB_04535 [Arenicella sp.]